jgi:phosphoribosylanthranilate isomerase
MPRTRIKICGVRRVEDALAAAGAGADAVGIVMHPAAKRHVTADVARDIAGALPAFVTPVLLFVDADVAHVMNTTRDLGLRHVQLNGDESPENVANLAPFRVIKAIKVDTDFGKTLATWRDAVARLDLRNLVGLVLETARTGKAGGSGVENDWNAVERAAKDGLFQGLPPVIAAGGLSPTNVSAVVRRLRPYAVDVSSGVEGDVIGEKSPAKIDAFVKAVHSADTPI